MNNKPSAGALASGDAINIPIEKFALSNGMRVILSEDHSVPVVTVYIIYGVGARSEERGRTGFAHLFEHMMFQGSVNAPKGTHFKLVESNGGAMNGSTHPDYTDYFEVLPANQLAVGLWLESDRMRQLAITQENLDNQREAVKQERRLSFDNQPYATAIVDRWPEIAFRNWQNSHSLIGSFEDLDAASVEDVARFFRTYYAPNNAVLVISGDIDAGEARRLVEAYFGDIAPQPQPVHPDLSEPAVEGPRWETWRDSLARVPGVIAGWPGPVRRSRDFSALNVLDVVLTAGESSRFQQNLVKGRKSVIQFEANLGWPFAGSTDYKDPGLYAMFMLYNPAFTSAQIIGQVEEEIEAVKQHGVGQDELERARTLLRSSRFRDIQSSHSRAALLAKYELLDGNPEYLNTELREFLSISADEIQDAARRYLVPEMRTVLEIAPGVEEAETA